MDTYQKTIYKFLKTSPEIHLILKIKAFLFITKKRTLLVSVYY